MGFLNLSLEPRKMLRSCFLIFSCDMVVSGISSFFLILRNLDGILTTVDLHVVIIKPFKKNKNWQFA